MLFARFVDCGLIKYCNSKPIPYNNTTLQMESSQFDADTMTVCAETTEHVSNTSEESPSTSIAVVPSTKTHATIDRTLVFTVLIALVGVGASSAYLGLGIQGAGNDKRLQFDKQASERIKAVEIAWHDFEVAGLWIHEACRSSADQKDSHLSRGLCSREDFLELYEYLLSSGLDFQAAAWVPNVTHVDRSSMEEDSRICKYKMGRKELEHWAANDVVSE